MGERKTDPRKQFSKWLARYGAIAWGVFLAAVIAVLIIVPETANACVYLVLIVTINKIVDTLAYTRNSTIEKILLAGLDKTKIELSMGNGGKIEKNGDGGNEGVTEEGGNG